MKKLYHASRYMPEHVRANAGCAMFASLIWSGHARREIANDKYGAIPASAIPLDLYAHEWELVEAETINGTLSKMVYRREIDTRRSLVMVICPAQGTPSVGFVKTCWVNLNTDRHHTLDRSKYAIS